ncbi:MAG: tripartite tricarboxylate transporter substrate binding protein [Burkholderiales bacterium]|nr:tripartite tricarboxylate transporter substrate binding protein [Burkholderiales bacterium]
MRSLSSELAAIVLGMLLASGLAAQPYPTKPVRIIVPTPAGGNPDFVIRPIAQKLSESLKNAFIIDNRPGAAGTIGVELAARAAPDGHTLLLGAIGHVATPSALYPKLPFDAVRDLVPITLLVDAPFALFVHPSLPARSVKELVALARARPGQIAYGSFGVGSFTHFITEALNATAGVNMVHVPYKGSAPAQAALLGGEVMASFDALQATLPHIKSQRLRGLAIGAAKRAPVAPQLPTFAEAGVAGFNASAWFGLFAPVNTPPDLVAKLHAEAVKALANAELRAYFERAGMEVVASTSEQFGAVVRDDIARFRKVARDAGIRPE